MTYVPARNSIFLAVALGVAEARDLDAVWIGVNAIDYSGYPDCRPEFIEAFRGVAATGQKRGVEGDPIAIRTPLIESTKAEIVRLGLELDAPAALDLVVLPGWRRARVEPATPACCGPGASPTPAPTTPPSLSGTVTDPGAAGDILATEVFSAIQGEAALVGRAPGLRPADRLQHPLCLLRPTRGPRSAARTVPDRADPGPARLADRGQPSAHRLAGRRGRPALVSCSPTTRSASPAASR